MGPSLKFSFQISRHTTVKKTNGTMVINHIDYTGKESSGTSHYFMTINHIDWDTKPVFFMLFNYYRITDGKFLCAN